MARVVRVHCPKCGRDYEVAVTEEHIRAAQESITGVTGIVDIHEDHALVIFVDARGFERGVRVYTLLPRGEVGAAQRLSIPSRYLEGLKHVNRIVMKLASRGLIVEGGRSGGFCAVKVSEGDSELELSVSGGEVTRVGAWAHAFLKGVEWKAGKARLDTLLLALRVLDAKLDRAPPSYAYRVFGLLAAARNIEIRLSEVEEDLFDYYLPRISDVYPRHVMVYVLRSAGRTLYEAVREWEPLRVYEIVDCALALERRGVVSLDEVG